MISGESLKIVCAARNRGRRGTEKMTLAYMRALLAENHDAFLFLPEDGFLADDVRASEFSGRALFLPKGWRWKVFCLLPPRGKMRNILRGADVVVVHNALLESSLRRMTSAPIAAVNHLNKTRRMGRCDSVINLNKAMREKMRSEGGAFHSAPERSLLLMNGLSRVSAPPRSGRAGMPPVVGFAGALESFKGVFDLLAAAAQIQEPLRIVFAGEGGAREELEKRARAIRHPVEFRGWINDLSGFYEECDIFGFPSRVEACSLAMLEAMERELPIASVRTDRTEDLIRDGENGMLAPPGDIPALAEKLRALVLDEPLRRSLGARAREFVLANCAPEVFSRNLSAAMRQIKSLGRK